MEVGDDEVGVLALEEDRSLRETLEVDVGLVGASDANAEGGCVKGSFG